MKSAPSRTLPLTLREARAVLVGDRPGGGHVLGIDQATRSGWALVSLETGTCICSGAVTGSDAQEGVVRLLADLPGLCWASLLVVLEDHADIPATLGIPTSGILSLGESRGRWLALLAQAGHPDEARVLVAPSTWRKLLGTRCNIARDAWKAQALLWARAVTRRPIESDDEAEAVVIALWGASEGLVRWATRMGEQTRPVKVKKKKKGQGK
jgi:hypothetical protein